MNIDMSAVRAIEDARGIPAHEVLDNVGHALLSAYRQIRGPAEENTRARVDIDPEDGAVEVRLVYLDEDGTELREVDDTPGNLESVGARPVRDALFRLLRDAETGKAFDEYRGLVGTVVSGVVQRDAVANQRGIVVVSLGSEMDSRDGILLPAEQIPGEKLEHGDRVKAYVVDVARGRKGLQIQLSRTHPDLVLGLFELEVPEILEGSLEVVNIAREAGHRSKVSVQAKAKGLNAKGACIGPRGQRVRNITHSLGGEKIDIVEYAAVPADYIANALAPAKVVRVEILDETEQVARVIVPDYQLSLAIGREGQNVRLAARLTGWKIDIHSDAEDPDQAQDAEE